MRVLQSSKVAAGIDILADHFNKLREDLTSNHDHSSGKGGTIDHKDLAETDDMSGMGHRHDDLDVHLVGDGPGPNSIDNPGGSEGVHGLASGVQVAGYLGTAQVVFQAGVISPVVDEVVTEVNFPFAFSTCIGVVLSPHDAATSINFAYHTHTVNNDKFSYYHDGNLDALHWIAWGTK